MKTIAHFIEHVEIQNNGCWIWTGAQRSGYGGFGQELAHVWSYKEFVGPVPEGYDVGHKCHDEDLSCVGGKGDQHRLCTNPEHLKPQTHLENINSGRVNQYKDVEKCKYNHPLTEENTYKFGPDNKWRGCRTCRNARRQGKDPATYVRHEVGYNQWNR
jgi:hypothetical protein